MEPLARACGRHPPVRLPRVSAFPAATAACGSGSPSVGPVGPNHGGGRRGGPQRGGPRTDPPRHPTGPPRRPGEIILSGTAPSSDKDSCEQRRSRLLHVCEREPQMKRTIQGGILMLVLTRKIGERLLVPDCNILVRSRLAASLWRALSKAASRSGPMGSGSAGPRVPCTGKKSVARLFAPRPLSPTPRAQKKS